MTVKYFMDEFSKQEAMSRDAIAGVIRLGETYNIPAKNFTDGTIGKFQSKLKFNKLQDIHAIGKLFL